MFRQDAILRIQHLNDGIAASQRPMEKLMEEAVASKEYIQRQKNDPGIIDPPKTGVDNPD